MHTCTRTRVRGFPAALLCRTAGCHWTSLLANTPRAQRTAGSYAEGPGVAAVGPGRALPLTAAAAARQTTRRHRLSAVCQRQSPVGRAPAHQRAHRGNTLPRCPAPFFDITAPVEGALQRANILHQANVAPRSSSLHPLSSCDRTLGATQRVRQHASLFIPVRCTLARTTRKKKKTLF